MSNNEISKKSSSGIVSLDSSLEDIDISNLSKESQDEIRKYAAIKKIDLHSSINEMQRDLQVTSLSVNNVRNAIIIGLNPQLV